MQMSRRLSCVMNPTRHGLMVLTLLSSTLRCRLCRSGMSPGMVKETIWRFPPRDFVDAGEAAQDQAGPGGTVAFAHDILVLLQDSHLHRQGLEGLALVIGQDKDALELADERIVAGVKR